MQDLIMRESRLLSNGEGVGKPRGENAVARASEVSYAKGLLVQKAGFNVEMISSGEDRLSKYAAIVKYYIAYRVGSKSRISKNYRTNWLNGHRRKKCIAQTKYGAIECISRHINVQTHYANHRQISDNFSYSETNGGNP